MIGTITPNPSIDRRAFVSKLNTGDLNRILREEDCPAGKGMNVSKVVKELGGQTRAYALVGGFCGRWFKKLVKDSGIHCRTMAIGSETRINLIIHDGSRKIQTQVNGTGPTMNRDQAKQFLGLLSSTKPSPIFWVLSGSLPSNAPPTFYFRLIHALQKNGVRCILDTDGEALREGVKAKPFMIKPNLEEMGRLVGNRALDGGRAIVQAGRSFVKKGISLVVVSQGAQGAFFITKDGAFQVVGPKIRAINHAGCGDALVGGFLVGLQRSMSLRDAARLGVSASVSAAMRLAPRLCLRTDIGFLLSKIKIRECPS